MPRGDAQLAQTLSYYRFPRWVSQVPNRHERLLSRGKVLEFVKRLVQFQLPNLRLFVTTRLSNVTSLRDFGLSEKATDGGG
jgi:hypothetical protein